MTSIVLSPVQSGPRSATPRHYLMCPPTFFDVSYAINPWMRPGVAVDRARALEQWGALVESYRAAGHRVDLLEPVPGLPDLVFAANGATVLDGHVLQARFANPQRAAEAEVHAAWHATHLELTGAVGIGSSASSVIVASRPVGRSSTACLTRPANGQPGPRSISSVALSGPCATTRHARSSTVPWMACGGRFCSSWYCRPS